MKMLKQCTLLIILFTTVTVNAQVGIGTTTPLARLHVTDSSVLFSAAGDIPTNPGNVPISGGGRRMMWYPDKAAFRVGYVTGSRWDKDNIGNFSFASGYDAIAIGRFSTSIGGGTMATGLSSTAMGSSTVASGDGSTAIGIGSTSSGESSTSMGFGTTAIGDQSTSMGNDTRATGTNSTALGNTTMAEGNTSTAMGNLTKAFGDSSTAMGASTTASGNTSTAMGYTTQASGTFSTAMGSYTNSSGFASTSMGNSTEASGFSSTSMGAGTTASGQYSVAMGYSTTASGDNSVAIGTNVNTNNFKGSFFFGDSDPHAKGVRITGVANEFAARFNGGYYFIAGDVGPDVGVHVVPGGNSWSTISDVNRKENFEPVNGDDFLEKIASFNLSSWNYKGQDAKTFRHYGPMAQEFYKAFGKDDYGIIGCDTLINQQDFLGVNLIAIQALEKRTTELQKENDDFKKENDNLKARLDKLEKIIGNKQ
ncbi:MAG: tail fiber domain-containing protein [Ginsengibacter sp.]